MKNYCVDANIFITAWYINYPINIFPSLWEKIANKKDEIILIKPIFDEIEPISSSDHKLEIAEKRTKYPIRMWLIENGFTETSIDDDINKTSLELEKAYEINDISKGADNKDILLISYAKEKNKTVVTLEGNQPQKPKEKYNYKIPLICQEQKVKCIDFVQMIGGLGIRI
ncbi:DUF4411 family protein [bacterium]|nr:DUF4411 family protein [bacterium]MBU1754575.1 DUF4411 family protein [bacterium]